MGLALGATLPAWGQEVEVANHYEFSKREIRTIERDLRETFRLLESAHFGEIYGSENTPKIIHFCGYLRPGTDAERVFSGMFSEGETYLLRLEKGPDDRAVYEQLCHEFGVSLGEYAGQAE